MRPLLIACLFLILSPSISYAWGRDGHHIVAEVASRYLDNITTKKVAQALGGMSFEDAATWMDDQRGNHAYDYMKPWHYINIEKGGAYVPGENNIVTALSKAYNELRTNKTLSAEARRTDLLIIFHLVGDMHQPLHVGYGIDKGGNTLQVQFNGRGTNLHHVWDDNIIQTEGITAESVLTHSHELSSQERLRLSAPDFVAWMNESRALLPQVYDFSGHTLSNGYTAKNKGLVEMQLLRAAIRLSSLLKIVFNQPAGSSKDDPMTVAKAALTTEQAGPVTVPVSAIEASRKIGEYVSVCDSVYGTKYLASSGITFINIGGTYPNSPLTLVIYEKDKARFPYKPEEYFSGKKVCFSGNIIDYKGKAEIIVSNPDQVRIE